MASKTHAHLIEIDENERTLTIYRVSESDRHLYTSTKLPETTWVENPEAIREFSRTLGENIVLDSPQARTLLGLQVR